MKHLIDRLHREHFLKREEWIGLFQNRSAGDEIYARELARRVCEETYRNDVYLRGLIEKIKDGRQ